MDERARTESDDQTVHGIEKGWFVRTLRWGQILKSYILVKKKD
jgi:hypothetical protein